MKIIKGLKIRLFLSLSLLYVGLFGCAAMPTHQEIASLDYGPPITIDYEKDIKHYFDNILFDPYSAVYSFEPPRTYWYKDIPLMGGQMYAGYLISVSVNAKNRMGGYVGKERYGFIFKNNVIIKVLTLDVSGEPTDSVLHSQ